MTQKKPSIRFWNQNQSLPIPGVGFQNFGAGPTGTETGIDSRISGAASIGIEIGSTQFDWVLGTTYPYGQLT